MYMYLINVKDLYFKNWMIFIENYYSINWIMNLERLKNVKGHILLVSIS